MSKNSIIVLGEVVEFKDYTDSMPHRHAEGF
jgi:hypothetical protein